MQQAVVLVHGIWMLGFEMLALKRGLRRCGFASYQFRYRSVSRSPAYNAQRLDAFLGSLEADVIHIVAHSLGGIIVLHLFEQFPNQKPGRILMLGTPLKGSGVARSIDKVPLVRSLLGRSVDRGILGDVPPWHGARELGAITGNRGFGLGGFFFGGLGRPNDGTVALSETRSPVITVEQTVPCSHTGMLWSSRVVEMACRYLHTGEFGTRIK